MARITRSGATPSPNQVARTPATGGKGAGSGRKRAAPPTAGNDGAEKRQRVDNLGDSPPIDDNVDIDVPSVGLEDVAEEVLSTALAQENMTPERAIDELDELSSIYEVPQISSRRSRSSRSGLDLLEEVAESPMHAPGSGQRQALSPNPAQAQNARLREVMGTPTRLPRDVVEADESPTSARGRIPEQAHTLASPELERRPGTVTATPRPERLEEDDEIDELSPDQPTNLRAEERFSDEEEVEEPEEVEDDEEQEASEIPDAEAAKQLQSRRRQRNLDLEDENLEESEAEADILTAARNQTSGKRLPASFDDQHLPTKASPAQQRAPKARMTAPKPKPKPKPAKKDGATAAKKQGGAGPRSTELIPVTAYRMTRPATAPSDSEDDILAAAIPFAARSGVNAVDVLSQVCDEILGGAVEALEQGALRADEEGSTGERREYRTKLRAVEAWGEEVRWKLMELTISLDAEYAMRKRVKAAVKEKVELRGELLRIRAERERVALRMDGVRIRHEEEGMEAEVSIPLHHTLLYRTQDRGSKADMPGYADTNFPLNNPPRHCARRLARPRCRRRSPVPFPPDRAATTRPPRASSRAR